MRARVSREASPATIEDDLAALWRDTCRDGPVARAVMANLVICRGGDASGKVDLAAPIENVPIDEIARRHPSRLILLHHDGGPSFCAPVDAIISILLFGPPQACFGVEIISVRSACAEASLPSIVRRLSLGDMPTSIWWTEDLSRGAPPEALVTLGRQFVYDSRHWTDVRRGVMALAPLVAGPHPVDLVDLNWRRLTPMRQAITQALAPPMRPIEVDGVRFHLRHAPGDASLAWLFAGWLGSRLAWKADVDKLVTIEEGQPNEGILSLTIGADLTATLDVHRVLVKDGSRGATLSVTVPHETEADAVAAELHSLTSDVCLNDALVAISRLATSERQ